MASNESIVNLLNKKTHQPKLKYVMFFNGLLVNAIYRRKGGFSVEVITGMEHSDEVEVDNLSKVCVFERII